MNGMNVNVLDLVVLGVIVGVFFMMHSYHKTEYYDADVPYDKEQMEELKQQHR